MNNLVVKRVLLTKRNKSLDDFIWIITVLGENNLDRAVFFQLGQRLLKCTMDVLLKIFIYRAETTGYTRNDFIQQDQFIFINLVDDMWCHIFPINKMWDDDKIVVRCCRIIE